MSHERTRRKNTQRASEMNLAAILLCIVVVFIICHFPRILLNVHELIMLDDMIECGESGKHVTLLQRLSKSYNQNYIQFDISLVLIQCMLLTLVLLLLQPELKVYFFHCASLHVKQTLNPLKTKYIINGMIRDTVIFPLSIKYADRTQSSKHCISVKKQTDL